MGRRRGITIGRRVVGDISDSGGMAVMRERFLEWMGVRNYSERTVSHRKVNLNYFILWSEERGITRPIDITKPILERYQRWLYHYKTKEEKPLSFRVQQARLIAVRMFFRWLTKNNTLLYNPASEIELPKGEQRLPKHVLTASEADQIMNQTDIKDALGIRDRAILETFYSTGIRRLELANLKVYDLDRERETLIIRQGKGKKDRVLPIGERALQWLEKYQEEVRPSLVASSDEGFLFLTMMGDPLQPKHLSQLVRDYVDKAKLGKTGSCHLFRHTMATLMLENGADVRFVQQMLGHASLETTQLYTQVSIKKLKEIHRATHPARLQKAGEKKKINKTIALDGCMGR